MKTKVVVTILAAFVIILMAVGIGSVFVPPGDIFAIIGHKLFGTALPEAISGNAVSIIWIMRLPRVLLAFIVGAALSVSGVVMQSVLKNPLASSYTLGVSSGASLGASLVLLFGITVPMIQTFSMPVMGFLFGMGTLLLAIAFAQRIDKRLENNTIILTGMVISLFVNAVVTLLSSFRKEQLQSLIYWQMGSFSMKEWSSVLILLPICIVGTIIIAHYNREMDMMTFGEEQASSMGVNIKRVKWILLTTAAAITGTSISFAGVIGFIDLVAPHIVRRVFGSSHRYVVPMSAVFGGAFMVVCDLVARTIVSPKELPVGAITAMIGAPFFAYIFFSKRNKA